MKNELSYIFQELAFAIVNNSHCEVDDDHNFEPNHELCVAHVVAPPLMARFELTKEDELFFKKVTLEAPPAEHGFIESSLKIVH